MVPRGKEKMDFYGLVEPLLLTTDLKNSWSNLEIKTSLSELLQDATSDPLGYYSH